jgi:hypothetical protein
MGNRIGQDGNRWSIFTLDSMEQLIAGIRTKGKLEPIKRPLDLFEDKKNSQIAREIDNGGNQ